MIQRFRTASITLFVFLLCLLQVDAFASFGFYNLNPNRIQTINPVGPNPITPPPIPGGVPVEAGFMSFVVQNLTGQPDDQVYLLTFGKDSSGDAGYLDIDTMTGKGTFTVASSTTESESFSVLYSDLPVLDANSRYIQVPQPFTSARMYFSIRYPLILAIGVDSMTGDPTIVDPDSTTAQDPNNNTLYDKVEYTYNNPPASSTDSNLFINPTAVDFFTLPISVRVANPVPSGQIPLSGLNFARSGVNAHIQEVFDRFDLTSAQIWSDLYINFLSDPEDASSEVIATLRVSAPDESNSFPLDYLNNPTVYGFSYTRSDSRVGYRSAYCAKMISHSRGKSLA